MVQTRYHLSQLRPDRLPLCHEVIESTEQLSHRLVDLRQQLDLVAVCHGAARVAAQELEEPFQNGVCPEIKRELGCPNDGPACPTSNLCLVGRSSVSTVIWSPDLSDPIDIARAV